MAFVVCAMAGFFVGFVVGLTISKNKKGE